MRGLIITGTSGVGKSFLEAQLAGDYNFYPLTKYTDRPARPGESTRALQNLTSEEFMARKNVGEFIFTLEYMGFNYAWTKADAISHQDKILVLAVTLESMRNIFDNLPGFKPVLLTIDPGNLQLIEERMKLREDFANLPPEKKSDIARKIQIRMDLARQELANVSDYGRIVERHGGRVFTIVDNTTLFTDVIPWIYGEFKLPQSQ